MESCILCKKDFSNGIKVKVGEKGCKTLMRISKERDLHDLYRLLQDATKCDNHENEVLVHQACRKKFVDQRRLSKDEPPKKCLRSSLTSEASFNWKTKCFLCNKYANRGYSTVVEVKTLPIKEHLLSCSNSRNDCWGNEVQHRLDSCFDLVAEEAIYHTTCMNRFRLVKPTFNASGRPLNSEMMENLLKVCQWLDEGDDELHTVTDIYDKMVELSEGTECYSKKYLKTKLIEHYKDHIYVFERDGRSDIVGFKHMSGFFMEEFMKKKNQTSTDMIIAAAKVIKSDIREIQKDKTVYPSLLEMKNLEYESEWVPESLQIFLGLIFPSKLKQISIGQCIVQASRSRSLIAPIPFGIGVDLDKSFATKWFVDHLAKLGFSISSSEVKLFKESAIAHNKEEIDVNHQETENHPPPHPTLLHDQQATDPSTNQSLSPQVSLPELDQDSPFDQWAADNVDHNIRTLTGKGTFHGMGVISVCSKQTSKLNAIKRLRHRSQKKLSGSSIPITEFRGSSFNGLKELKLDSIKPREIIHAAEMTLDLIWHAAWFFASSKDPRPNWSGFMMHATSQSSTVYDVASIKFLPIIDLNSSDENCIYSTLLFVIEEAKKSKIPVPCITFDQPLWQKALGIIKVKKLSIVCRLGGFHTLMSFLGSIGNLMNGSGLEELFEEVYSEDTVKHITSGHAVARALRAHLLVQSALVNHITSTLVEENKLNVDELESFYQKAMKEGISNDELLILSKSEAFGNMEDSIASFLTTISEKSRTAKLWVVYIDYIKIVKEFIVAERSCNWYLHIQAIHKMLNLFAATGHRNYAKCARIYIQEMNHWIKSNEWLRNQFEAGRHAVRRSNRFWAGIWSDLVIEQTLMRSIKCAGGLTRGRGFGENVRNLWTMSIGFSASVHESMTKLSGVYTGSSDQNIDMGMNRRGKDTDDCEKFFDWIEVRNPFNMKDDNLHSLSTGVVSVKGKDKVNCDDAENIGSIIQRNLDGITFTESKIKKKDLLVSLNTLANSSLDTENSDAINVNPTLLLTRLAAIAEREDNVEQYFDYELNHQPLSLFKNGLMRKPDKAALRKRLLPDNDVTNTDVSGFQHVLDGGALLHRVYWVKGMQFSKIAEAYVSYVRRHYGQAKIVFDGYEDQMSIKANEHLRRSSKGSSQNITVNSENEVPYAKERFLSNNHNKSQLIGLLERAFLADGQMVTVCKGDADAIIVKQALNSVESGNVVVVADDTDVAVMLLYHWKETQFDIFLQSQSKCWSINEATCKIKDVKDHLLFIHAWSGCDSTSATFGKGKSSFLNIVQKSEIMQSSSRTMTDVWTDQKTIGNTAVDIFVNLFGGNKKSTLRQLRYSKYREMLGSGLIEPEKLPPSERSAYHHGLRVHLQIMQWLLLDEDDDTFKPVEWGWCQAVGHLKPIMTDRVIAPPEILHVIRCKCKTTSKNPCGTNLCSCRKNGLKCMSSCGGCHGESCNNKKLDQRQYDEEGFDDQYQQDDEHRNVFSDIFE